MADNHMNDELLPLSRICPSWKSCLIPSAFAALQEGLRRERARLGNRPFVTLVWREDYDSDGLGVTLELLESFPDQAAAVDFVEKAAETALAAALAEPSYGPYRWRLEDPHVASSRFKRGPAGTAAASVHSRTFKIANGSGYDSKYFQFEAIRVSGGEAIGPALFSFVDAEPEWTSFLISKGSAG
jgi:hypothetical protein